MCFREVAGYDGGVWNFPDICSTIGQASGGGRSILGEAIYFLSSFNSFNNSSCLHSCSKRTALATSGLGALRIPPTYDGSCLWYPSSLADYVFAFLTRRKMLCVKGPVSLPIYGHTRNHRPPPQSPSAFCTASKIPRLAPHFVLMEAAASW